MYNEKDNKKGNFSLSEGEAFLEKIFIRHAQQEKIGKKNN